MSETFSPHQKKHGRAEALAFPRLKPICLINTMPLAMANTAFSLGVTPTTLGVTFSSGEITSKDAIPTRWRLFHSALNAYRVQKGEVPGHFDLETKSRGGGSLPTQLNEAGGHGVGASVDCDLGQDSQHTSLSFSAKLKFP